MKELFVHRRSGKIALATLAFSAAAIAVYSAFFDVLIPNVANDSYRAAIGPLFIVPIVVLVFAQVGIGGFFLHAISSVSGKKSADLLRSLLIASVMAFLFSLTYMMFPKYGPFYFIVFVYSSSPWYALPLVAAWTFFSISVGAFLAHRLLKLPCKTSYLAAGLAYTLILAAAS